MKYYANYRNVKVIRQCFGVSGERIIIVSNRGKEIASFCYNPSACSGAGGIAEDSRLRDAKNELEHIELENPTDRSILIDVCPWECDLK